jgi:hypothetical protein
MPGQDLCASGLRDHVRLFGEMFDRQFGSWFVATPHREVWTDRGHVVVDWEAASRAFVEASTTRLGLRNVASSESRAWLLCDVNTDGLYQGVPFDGRAALVAINRER